jgi:2-polyprenyl-6-methoxyphenol hydroxylase-like FAD-dependent oxidoreductase
VDIAIAGGSAAGLFAALLLARAEHHAIVLERDCLEPAPDVESAAEAAFRSSAPQIVQPHIVMARCRQLLIDQLPDVYDGLLAAGVAEAPLWTQMPESLSDTSARPGDEQLTPMMTRRSTVDWVLQRAAAAEPRVTLRYGVKVTGLLATRGQQPHVTGVHTSQGDLPADLVIDATGRRSPVDDWRAEATAARDSRPGELSAAARGRLLRPGRLPRVLEDQRNGLPARAGLHRPGRRGVHAGNPPPARQRAASRAAHPRAAPRRPGAVRACLELKAR